MSFVTTMILTCCGEQDPTQLINRGLPNYLAFQKVDLNPKHASKAAEMDMFVCVLNYHEDLVEAAIKAVREGPWAWPDEMVLLVYGENSSVQVVRPESA